MKRDASDRDSDKSEKPNQFKLMNAIAAQMRPLLDDPRRRARANASILKTLTRHLGDSETELPLVANTPDQEKQADVLSAYLALASLQGSFSQCEFYFRRFPFSGLPINRAEHLRNVCEMYFDRIEQFRDRLKRLMNSLKAYAGDTDDRYGELIKQYGKEFRWNANSEI